MLKKVFLNTLAPPPHLNISNYERLPAPCPCVLMSPGLGGVPQCGPFRVLQMIRDGVDTQPCLGAGKPPFHLIKMIPFLLKLKRNPGTGHCVLLNLHTGGRRLINLPGFVCPCRTAFPTPPDTPRLWRRRGGHPEGLK